MLKGGDGRVMFGRIEYLLSLLPFVQRVGPVLAMDLPLIMKSMRRKYHIQRGELYGVLLV